MIQIVIIMGVALFVQGLLSSVQMKHLSDEFVQMRRRGKVAIGRKAGGFHAGAIVMFRIDDEGIIQESKKLEGVTAFARVKPLAGFEGRYVGELTEADGPRNHKNLGKAIADAALVYRKYTAGEDIPEPPSPFQRVGQALGSLGRTQPDQSV
ncbi:MAG: transcriptional regulator GutM [Coriobacteriales bacterium]|nr:transcriptional regulator GutM [Coriobacteriales bacterium]